MSVVKSFAVGNGDMYYIKHGSDNFTIIDCSLNRSNRESIVNEIKDASKGKGINRFISTHPDEDHICGLEYLDDEMPIVNFYCVKNSTRKRIETIDFRKYCQLKDSDKAFYIHKNCSRKWMNEKSDERGSSGINILWPDTSNERYIQALEDAENMESPNNISIVVQYRIESGASFMWFGDLDGDFLDEVGDKINFEKTSVIFAPHHGRHSGKIPDRFLKILNPDLIVIGEAPTEHIHYYAGYNKITQNSTGDIHFDCESDGIHVFVKDLNYSTDCLVNKKKSKLGWNYIGSININ